MVPMRCIANIIDERSHLFLENMGLFRMVTKGKGRILKRESENHLWRGCFSQ